MKVIGISPLDKDSTVSFMEDGKLVFACGEERLSRSKLQGGFPSLAMQKGFEVTGWKADDVTAVAYGFYDGEEEARLMREASMEDHRYHKSSCTSNSLKELKQLNNSVYEPDLSTSIPGFDSTQDEYLPAKAMLKRLIYKFSASSATVDWKLHRHFFDQWLSRSIADHKQSTQQLVNGLASFGLNGKLKRFNHHDTHAANAYYASGFDEALLVTLDGYGSGNCGGVYTGTAEGIKPLIRFSFPNSMGQFYEMVTSALGFKPGRHEGKIVGLAAYGDPHLLGPVLRERFVVENGDIRIRASMNYFFARALAQKYTKRDVAAAYQYVLEQVTKEVCEYWVNKTGIKKVAVSGGVNANVKLNQRILEVEGVERVFVYPNMGDGGCATGAAMLAFDKTRRPAPVDTVYLGPEYSDLEIENELLVHQLQFQIPGSIESSVAELLSQNKIVARFNGRMEYGPRALGNRSVLYPAQDPKVNLWLNHQLGRTEFMPFAPAVLASESDKMFLNIKGGEKASEFMSITFDCTDLMAETCPAAVHVDRTARPQFVTESSNESFHKILTAYHELTGVPAIINTSFNMHEEPIVCTPADAVRAFLLGNIEYLAIGPFLVPHPKLQSLAAAREAQEQQAA